MITDNIFDLTSYRIDPEPILSLTGKYVFPASIGLVFSPAQPAAISGMKPARGSILRTRRVSSAGPASLFAIKVRCNGATRKEDSGCATV
jgi:hypothetical protein